MHRLLIVALVSLLTTSMAGLPAAASDAGRVTAPTWCADDAVYRLVIQSPDADVPAYPGFLDRVALFERELVLALARRGLPVDPERPPDATIVVSIFPRTYFSNYRRSSGDKDAPVFSSMFRKWVKRAEVRVGIAHGGVSSPSFVDDDGRFAPIVKGAWQGSPNHHYSRWKLAFSPRGKATAVAQRLRKQRRSFCAGDSGK